MNINLRKNYSPNFQAGLTSKMKQEIKASDVDKISRYIARQGINNDFKENKVIAWCSLKCVQFLQELNKKYHLKLGLPRGILVADFNNLHTIENNSLGFVNFAPAKLHKSKDIVTPEKTIFFNELKHRNVWKNIDEVSDEYYEDKISPTNFFLETFLHEFMHVIHENNMINKYDGEKVVEVIKNAQTYENMEYFHKKFDKMLNRICKYASSNPFEAVACDFSKRAIENIDKKELLPTGNFIKSSPYRDINPFINWFRTFHSKNPLDHALRDFWNGKFGAKS